VGKGGKLLLNGQFEGRFFPQGRKWGEAGMAMQFAEKDVVAEISLVTGHGFSRAASG
jgi:hypothetical protein